jgi:transposase
LPFGEVEHAVDPRRLWDRGQEPAHAQRAPGIEQQADREQADQQGTGEPPVAPCIPWRGEPTGDADQVQVDGERTSASQLFRELREQGDAGSLGTVSAYVRPFRALGTAPPATPTPPKVRHVTSWLLRHPDSLDADDQVKLTDVLARCRHLDARTGHVSAFAELLTGRHGDRLDAWIEHVERDDLPRLRSFTVGLTHDHAAVVNGLTPPHGSGAVEGTVNRIKMLKRQMYGRAGFNLLRKRVLLAT